MRGSDLAASVNRVVTNGLCSGCGGCTVLSGVSSMVLGDDGLLLPLLSGLGDARLEGRQFRSSCPGVTVRRVHESGQTQHPLLGGLRGAWVAWACDDELRFGGSSGGVITALSVWLLDSGRVEAVVGAGGSVDQPTRTVARVSRGRQEVLDTAGSRYAPVSVISGLGSVRCPAVVVAKPCEAASLRALRMSGTGDFANVKYILSFFCAGTPRQDATDRLITDLGIALVDVSSVRYRGRGCPGQFEVQSVDGRSASMSYSESWGAHLGRNLATRCKLCIDGTGEAADIAVGDFWSSDAHGYPDLGEQPGRSIVIARTAVGLELLEQAIGAE